MHRELGFVDKFLGEVQAAGLSDGQRSRAQMPNEKPPQMTRADSQLSRQILDSPVQSVFVDQPQRPRDRVRRSNPRGTAG